MISNTSVSICNRFHARRANSGKITISKGVPLWCPRSRGISSPSGTKLSHKKLETRLSYGEDPESLSHLALNPYRVVTDGQTDRIPIANTRSQQYLPVQLSRVKTMFSWKCSKTRNLLIIVTDKNVPSVKLVFIAHKTYPSYGVVMVAKCARLS